MDYGDAEANGTQGRGAAKASGGGRTPGKDRTTRGKYREAAATKTPRGDPRLSDRPWMMSPLGHQPTELLPWGLRAKVKEQFFWFRMRWTKYSWSPHPGGTEMWGSDAEGPSLPMAAGRGCCRQSSFLGEARLGYGGAASWFAHSSRLWAWALAMTLEGRVHN